MAKNPGGAAAMKVAITGASGLVGTALVNVLRNDGHNVLRLVRPGGTALAGDARWNPATGELDAEALEGCDATVNFAGASIGEGRWSEARKKILRDSRIGSTQVLVGGLAKLKSKPRVLVSASAVGYYGDRGDEILAEASNPGNDFLAKLACDWEAQVLKAEASGIRTVILRFGVILSAHGGALPRMLTPFRMGMGGRLGSGKQWMSWLTLDEAVNLVRYAFENGKLRGPVNAVSPNAIRNADFTRVLARTLRRPALFPVPAFALRLLLGEMADALLLSSQRVAPQRLEAAGYSFLNLDLEPTLRGQLGR
jgi:uncharacterized protein